MIAPVALAFISASTPAPKSTHTHRSTFAFALSSAEVVSAKLKMLGELRIDLIFFFMNF